MSSVISSSLLSSSTASTSSVPRTSPLVPISSLLSPTPPDVSPSLFKMKPKPAKSFLDFPPEVRNKVYQLLHIGDHVIDPDEYSTELSSQFLATCRQVYDEARPVLYGNNTFTIELNNQWRKPDACVWGMPFLKQTGNNPTDPVCLLRRIVVLVKFYPHEDGEGTIEIAFRHVYHGILRRMRNIDSLNLRVLITRARLRIDEVPSGIWSWVRLGGPMARQREGQCCFEPCVSWKTWATVAGEWYQSVWLEELQLKRLLASTLGNLRQVRGLSMPDVPEDLRELLKERMESSGPLREPMPPPPFVPDHRDSAPNRENLGLYWPDEKQRREKRILNLPSLPGVGTFFKLEGRGPKRTETPGELTLRALGLDGNTASRGRPLSDFSISRRREQS